MKLRRNKKGFTLVELVVVIAILAILASVATVATVTILNNARKTPVTDTASSVKNQIQYWYASGTKTATTGKWGTASGDTLSGFLQSALQECKFKTDAKITTKPAKPTTDTEKTWIGCDDITNNLARTATADYNYHVYVYTKYYYCEITVSCDKDGNCKSITVGDAKNDFAS